VKLTWSNWAGNGNGPPAGFSKPPTVVPDHSKKASVVCGSLSKK